MTPTPATLDHAGIAARIPHSGTMCLLDALLHWSNEIITCTVHDATDPAHPLRLAGTLPATCAIELASQAMALHGALCAPAGTAVAPGFLASARDVRLHVTRLDDRAAPLQVQAMRVAGDGGQVIYRFELRDATGALLVDGRATVVLNQPLVAPTA